MKKILMIALLALLTVNMNCGGGVGDVSSGSAGTSLVTINVGTSDSGKAMDLINEEPSQYIGVTTIPPDVYKIVFTIAASDMPTIIKEVLVAGQETITETFSVPSGDNRYFLVEAKNASGLVLYQGDTTADLADEPVILMIYMTALDTTGPTVISTIPPNNATEVSITLAINITFSETIDPASFNSSTCTLRNNGSNVAGTIAVNGAVATFTPSSDLAYDTTYTGTISTGIRDLRGNTMAEDYIWSFMTGIAPDTTPPTVIGVSPGSGATDVTVTTTLTATFSEAMDESTINTSTFTLVDGDSNPVSGLVSYAGTTATFAPSSDLAPGITYTARVTSGVRDLAGNTMSEDYAWSFATKGTDKTPPSFDGLVDAIPDTTEVQLQWSAATDNVTPSSSITYLIYMAITSGGQNFNTPTAMTSPGATTYTATGLSPETMYCYVVRAKDEAGNIDANTVERCATTSSVVGPLSISPPSATSVALTNPDGSPADDVTFTISGGTLPYSVTSDNTVIIASPGAIPGSTFTVDPDITSSTCSGGLVTLTVTDSGSPPGTVNAIVDVQRPPVSFLPAGGSICENDNTCSAGTETLTLTLSGVAPLTLASDNPSVIPDPGSLSVYTYMIQANNNSIAGVLFDVLLTLTDSCAGGPFDAFITVINQDMYVDVNTGSDLTGDGTSSNPFKTITYALSVTPGDEAINIASGTYDASAGETFPFFLKNGTRLIGATVPSKPLITSGVFVAGFGDLVNGYPSPTIANNEINNLELYSTVVTAGTGPVWDRSGNNFSIRDCIIHGSSGSPVVGLNGVYLTGDNFYVSDSEIYDFGWNGLTTDSTGTIEGNNIHDNGNTGLLVRGNSTINNNAIYCNASEDLRIASTVTFIIDATNNAWDNNPVWVDTTGTCGGGVDVCYTAPGTPAPDTSGNTQVPYPCP